MTNEERLKAMQCITTVIDIYSNSEAKGGSIWCRFAQGSNKLRDKWKYRAVKSVWYIGIIGVIYYLFM